VNEDRFASLIRDLYRTVRELQDMFGRPFTPDGHMVGSMGECIAQHYYGPRLMPPSNKGHDAKAGEHLVEIKTTQGNSVALRDQPERLLVLRIKKDGSWDEVYNGPGAPVWALVAGKPRPSNGQYKVSLSSLRKIRSDPTQRIERVRGESVGG